MLPRNEVREAVVREIEWAAVSPKEQAHQLCRYCPKKAVRMKTRGRAWALVCADHAYENPLCPECECEKTKVRLRFLRKFSEQWGTCVTTHRVYRCPHCRTKLVATNGRAPEVAADWL